MYLYEILDLNYFFRKTWVVSGPYSYGSVPNMFTEFNLMSNIVKFKDLCWTATTETATTGGRCTIF